MKDLSISFSRVIIVQHFKAVIFYVLMLNEKHYISTANTFSLVKPGFHYMANATTTTQKQSD